jgi:hypothetical protein
MATTFDITIESCNGARNTVAEWITQSCVLNFKGLPSGQSVDLELILVSGEAAYYDYFPFLLEATIAPDNVEIFEIGMPTMDYSFWLRNVPADQNGEAFVSIRAELSGTPSQLGLANDERPLVAELAFVTVHPCSTIPSIHLRLAAVSIAFSRAQLKVDENGPVFVIGCYRSGTSILTWALGQHPDILPLEETNWLRCALLGAMAGYRQSVAAGRNAPELYDLSQEQYLRWVGKGFDEMHHCLGRDRALRVSLQRTSEKAEDYHPDFQIVRSRWNPKRRWVDGTPENTGVAYLLAQAFPTSQFIAMVRNPRDVVASLINFNRAGGKPYTQDQAIDFWLSMTEIAMLARELLGPQRVRLVFYEDMIEDPITVLREIFAFLGEPNFSQSGNTFSKRINSSSTDQADINGISNQRIYAAEEVFRQLRAGASASEIYWGSKAISDLDEYNNDLIENILTTLSTESRLKH